MKVYRSMTREEKAFEIMIALIKSGEHIDYGVDENGYSACKTHVAKKAYAVLDIFESCSDWDQRRRPIPKRAPREDTTTFEERI